MIKVILVDDEYLVIERLKNCIRWEEAGFEIVGQALNGEEALEIVARLQPQVAVVDINMPLIDGLEFSKIARVQYPDLKIVILSGYSSFEYARSALQVGVSDYLLKPVNTDELYKFLDGMKLQILQEAQFKSYLSGLELTSEQNDLLLKERWLQSLLTANNEFPDEPAARKFQEYFPDRTVGQMYVIVIRVNKSDEETILTELPNQSSVMNGIFAETMKDTDQPIIFPDSEGRIVIFINGNRLEIESVIAGCEKGRRKVKQSMPVTITMGVSNRHCGIEALGAAYQEALIALENGIIFGTDRVIAYASLEKNQSHPFQIDKIRQDLLIEMRLKDGNAIEEKLNQIFRPFHEQQATVAILNLVLSELWLIATDFSLESGMKLPETAGSHLNPAGLIRQSATLEDIRQAVLAMVLQLINSGPNFKKSGPQRIVEQAKQFIDANYDNPNINLDRIAKHIFVNPSHLSNIFKKETGIALMEYLREQRMLKAKELIDQGLCNIADIAERVGFNDENYFSKCFKKKYGVTPSVLTQAKQ